MRAEMAAPWLVRNRIREWLDAWSWPAELVDDVEYAVSEAVSNVAEHAYRGNPTMGNVVVEAIVETRSDASRRLRITVRDHGRWKPVTPDPAHRGRGLFMMRELMDEVVIRRADSAEDEGTEVVLVSPAAPPAPG
ncbi:MAG: serine/threonine-protein kinase RsbW [Pseudonocardiales bacterium]|jgi:anti-sigma regulatory factor (Ser/Thr protein kinase)|uniref:ATP-binding protein n=1 Tax=Pseudonocardia sp. TaxID=60912 RepID=UPI00260335F9|nr:ATP-binding protein [Pseudonocardia sp.]MCW2722315.1 ATP-binding protein [Pseudonocardia sp.]MDT7705345.1 serine/threonine-protein kinase RsbW [Pseudonocardiales bacterium]